jgi:hypothetical protein
MKVVRDVCTMTYRNVQWGYWIGADYWHDKKAWEPWELCALSLSIEPTSMNAGRTSYSIGPWVSRVWGEDSGPQSASTLLEFNRRLSLLAAEKSNSTHFTLRSDGKLLVHEFVNWAHRRDCANIPLALERLVANPQQQAEWTDIAAELSASEAHAHSQFPDHPDESAMLLTPEFRLSVNAEGTEPSTTESSQEHSRTRQAPAIAPANLQCAETQLGRRNLLDATIDTAVKSAGSHDNAAIYLELKELALRGEPPFTGAVDASGRLAHTNMNNIVAWFSKDSLSKRLRRRELKALNPTD